MSVLSLLLILLLLLLLKYGEKWSKESAVGLTNGIIEHYLKYVQYNAQVLQLATAYVLLKMFHYSKTSTSNNESVF